MPGVPGSATPWASMLGVWRDISIQIEGSVRPRCGSLQSIGSPDEDLEGPTAQLLLPSNPGDLGFTGEGNPPNILSGKLMGLAASGTKSQVTSEGITGLSSGLISGNNSENRLTPNQ